MEYVNKKEFTDYIKQDADSLDFLNTIKGETDEFFKKFHDDPAKMSRWAHHYFCKKDGGLLVFDVNKPNKHVCSICKEAYENDELLNGVWHTMYRNLAATSAWKSAVVYKYSGDKQYFDNVVTLAMFYAENYDNFILHNKEGLEFDSLENAKWGCSRIMPQSLNEAIFIIRLINALEIIKSDLSKEFIIYLQDNFFKKAFAEMKSQVNQVHNIRCWHNAAIGIMGLFTGNTEMTSFAFGGEYNIERQLREGVTQDKFWYEGSIHYNFFLLEGVVNLLLFCKIYKYDFSIGEKIVEDMLKEAFNYAFDNHKFPNPNDGWPNINLKTYSYIYAMAAKVLGKDSLVSRILGEIVNKDGERATIPLSRPYYYKNDVSLEEFLFAQGIRGNGSRVDRVSSYNYSTSYCGLIKAEDINVFVKYGHNGPSHAHPDKMNIEVMLLGETMSRDLSNSGYGNPFCNEWHRVSASHNTVVADGKSHSNIKDGGVCKSFEDTSISVECRDVYEGIDFERSLNIAGRGFSDKFTVKSETEHTYDYLFHVEGELIGSIETADGDLGFSENGYQHISDVKKIITDKEDVVLRWDIQGVKASCKINLEGKQLFLGKSPDNPVDKSRNTIIIRQCSTNAEFSVDWEREE